LELRVLKEITVEVTQQCNSNCIFCSSLSEGSSRNEIPFSKLQEISLFAKSNHASTINISGGEPLLYPEIISFLSFNKSNNLYSTIYTSGNSDFKAFFTNLRKTKITNNDLRFIFNYQSVDCDIFAKLTNIPDRASFNLVNENILLCLSNGFDVEVHIVPNAININSIFETCSYLKEIGISKVSLLRIVYQGRAKRNKETLIIKNKELLSLTIAKIRKELCDNNFALRLGVPYNMFSTLRTPCYAGSGKMIIKYNGKVYPCEAFKEIENNISFILGDIYNESLDSIWNRNLELLEFLKMKIRDSVCESCPAQLLQIS
jgi:radical SAM protein with 4Fe4S-binding SPASM domain